MIYYIYNSDDIIGFTYNNQNYYYIKNAQNDIIGILDNTYTKIVDYSYDSWGNILSITGNTTIGNINPFRYRSYYYDQETNLYYLNSRYYNPTWGRFLNCDDYLAQSTVVYGLNLYQYANNNPINFADNGGTWPKFDFIKDIYNKAKNVIKKVKDAFVVNISVGPGFESLPIGYYTPVSKTIDIIKIKNGQISTNESSTFTSGYEMDLFLIKKGKKNTITEYNDSLNYNPANGHHKMLNNPTTETSIINYTCLIPLCIEQTDNKDMTFFGIDHNSNLIINIYIQIGFQI